MATRANMISESEAIHRLIMDKIKLSTVDGGTKLAKMQTTLVEAIYQKIESDSIKSLSIGKMTGCLYPTKTTWLTTQPQDVVGRRKRASQLNPNSLEEDLDTKLGKKTRPTADIGTVVKMVPEKAPDPSKKDGPDLTRSKRIK